MSFHVQHKGESARITVPLRFDATVYRDFKEAYAPLVADKSVKLIEVDLSATEYLDSAALGMLSQLKESAENARKSVSLVSLPGAVAHILKVAHADRLFTITLPDGVKFDLN